MATTNRLVGNIEPREYTPPLRKLTRRTTGGFDVIDWATNDLGVSLYPHQKWIYQHALEYKPGSHDYRFRKVLLEKARRNAKTHTVNVLTLYRMTHGTRHVLFTSAELKAARESLLDLEEIVRDRPGLFGKYKLRQSLSMMELHLLDHNSRFTVLTANRRGGRAQDAGLIIEDELREHDTWEAHSAAEPAMVAVRNSQLFMCSNAGDRRSVVLNHFRALALDGSDPTLFYAGWTAKPDCEIDDPEAWKAANPLMGRLWDADVLVSAMSKPATEFKTENLCVSVPSLNAAVSPPAWEACLDPATMEAHRSRVVVGLDVSPDLQHVTAVAAASMDGGRVRIETVGEWHHTADVRAELPDLLARIQPRHLVWIPSGPSAAISTDLKEISRNMELSGSEISSACMGFAELTSAARIAHNGDQLLTSHVLGAAKSKRGDGWVFNRNDGWCDGAYAAAIAVHIARTIPPPQKLRVITAGSRR